MHLRQHRIVSCRRACRAGSIPGVSGNIALADKGYDGTAMILQDDRADVAQGRSTHCGTALDKICEEDIDQDVE